MSKTRMMSAAFALGLLLTATLHARADKSEVYAAVNVSLGYNYDALSESFEYTYERWVLFADGSVYDGIPKVPLSEFDVPASKKKDPKAWGTWKIEKGDLEVVWNGAGQNGQLKPRVYDSWFKLETPKAGATLSGTYARLGAVSQSVSADTTFSATGWKTIVFQRDGTFSSANGGSSSYSSSSGSVNTTHRDGSGGTYKITGPLIEMKYSDGPVVRASLFYSSKDQKILFLNGVELIRR
jgi:hypothetical protein